MQVFEQFVLSRNGCNGPKPCRDEEDISGRRVTKWDGRCSWKLCVDCGLVGCQAVLSYVCGYQQFGGMRCVYLQGDNLSGG